MGIHEHTIPKPFWPEPLSVPADSPHPIHIINPFRNADGGSEWEALTLFELLRNTATPNTVKLWSNQPKGRISPQLLRDYPIQPRRRVWGKRPRRGTFIFVGTGQRVHRWFDRTRPSRVILIYNLPGQAALDRLHQRAHRLGITPEVVHISQWMRQASGYDGVIHYSPIDLDRFTPATGVTTRPFTVGRLSRDTDDKFSSHDPDLFRTLATAGCRIKIMGGTVLAPRLAGVPGIELLPVLHEPPEQFLQSLDCFFYRTNENWPEPFGRVVMEAMASGLPVVCEDRGGYAEVIDHGVDGFLFSTNAEAIDYIEQLRTNPALRATIGARARQKMERLFSGDALMARVNYYLASHPPHTPA